MINSLMTSTNYCIIVFQSTHHAIAAEKTIQAAEIPLVVIPTPKDISASCGLALKINTEDYIRAVNTLKDRGISTIEAYEINTLKEPKIKKLSSTD